MNKKMICLFLLALTSISINASESINNYNKFLKKENSNIYTSNKQESENTENNQKLESSIEEVIMNNDPLNENDENRANTSVSENIKYEKTTYINSLNNNNNQSEIKRIINFLDNAKIGLSSIEIENLDKEFAIRDIDELIKILEKSEIKKNNK